MKANLVDFIAAETGLTKADAGKALDATLKGIMKGLEDEGKVALVGFGTFSKKERAAREGRNPQTGETLKIAASKSVKFKASSALKDALNK